MSDQNVYVYPSDPGDEVLLGKGSVINAVLIAQKSQRFATGTTTLGLVGQVTNDRGAPGVPVLLENGMSDLSAGIYGPLDPTIGEGYAAGYEGNLAALCDGLDAARVVLCPVDIALKDKTITDATAVNVKATLARGALSFTVEESDDVWTVAGHKFVADDTFTIVTLTGGAGAAVATTYHVIAPVVANTSFKASATQGGASLTITLDGSGTLRPLSMATAPSTDALTVPAGTRIKTSNGGFIVRTLEALYWGAGEFAAKTVRLAKVSGTEAAINTVNAFVTTIETGLVVDTTATTVPDAIDAAELVLRYEAMLDVINNDPLGADIDVIFTDRNEAAINDALSVHCEESQAAGVFRIGVVAPPVGTTLANARLTTGDGVGRAALSKEFVAYVHPGVKRAFPEDAANLTGPDYVATVPAQALYAAIICGFRPEQNPSEETSPMLRRYGVAGIESPQGGGGAAHWSANIVTPKMVKGSSGAAVWFRDGVMADGGEISTIRTRQFVIQELIAKVQPYQKSVATTANQEGASDACFFLLDSLKAAERILTFQLSRTWNGSTRHLKLIATVVEIGTMNVITIVLNVTTSDITVAVSVQPGA